MSQKTSYPQKRKSTSSAVLHEVEIVYSNPRTIEVKILNSRDAFEFLLENVFDKRKLDYKEMFAVLLLNKANTCIGYSLIGMGDSSGTIVNLKEIVQLALLTNSSSVILSHNHPSRNMKPSDADTRITKQIKEACGFFEIQVLDHIIVSSTSYYSFCDEGYL